MKKLVMTGALATVLVAGGGTGVYIANAKANTSASSSTAVFTQQQGISAQQMANTLIKKDSSIVNKNFDKMQNLMQDPNVNFGQMKPYMKQMHPNLSDQQLEDLYKSMHGTGGSSNSVNFQDMMGSGSM